MSLYLSNSSEFRENWNTIQSDFRCCGFDSGNWGGQDYLSLGGSNLKKFMMVSDNYCVPESCCIEDEKSNGLLCQKRNREDCGSGDQETKRVEMKIKQINIRACPHVIQEIYENEIPQLFVFIAINGGLTIIAEVITIALASAFVTKLARRAKRYDARCNMDTNLGN